MIRLMMLMKAPFRMTEALAAWRTYILRIENLRSIKRNLSFYLSHPISSVVKMVDKGKVNT